MKNFENLSKAELLLLARKQYDMIESQASALASNAKHVWTSDKNSSRTTVDLITVAEFATRKLRDVKDALNELSLQNDFDKADMSDFNVVDFVTDLNQAILDINGFVEQARDPRRPRQGGF